MHALKSRLVSRVVVVPNLKTRALAPPKRRWHLKSKFLMFLALGIGGSIFSLPLLAHHGGAAYDMEKGITLKGTVTEWVWSNPHCVLRFDVTDDHGQVVQWSSETENPSSMIHQGWTREAIKIGDQITITVNQAKNGRPVGRIVEILLPNGQRLAGRGVAGATKPDEYPKQ